MRAPILKQGRVLIATIDTDPSDDELARLREDLAERVGTTRAKGVIVDVTLLDVIDSYGVRTLQSIAHSTRLRGAMTIVAGIQPEVAMAMVLLGQVLEGVDTALDLEDALELLDARLRGRDELYR
jgi:rsbT antagonist protein RsbS